MKKIAPLLLAVAFFSSACLFARPGNAPTGKRFTGTLAIKRQIAEVGLSTIATAQVSASSQLGSTPYYANRFYLVMQSMAVQLTRNLKGYKNKAPKIVVSTFVPVGGYENAEPFGRLCAQQMVVSLSQQNFRVQEMMKMPKILVDDSNGFFVLSDKLANLGGGVNTDLILAGTYAMVKGDLLVNGYILDAKSGEVVSTSTSTLNISSDTFIGPLVAPLTDSAAYRKGSGFTGKHSLTIRDKAINGSDSSSKYLSLKIDGLSHQLARNMRRGGNEKVLIVSTFVDFDRFYTTHTFGRYLTEQLMDRMVDRGFTVVEVRVAKELMIQPNLGEIALSRDIEEMMNKYEADTMLIGTYKKIGDSVVVNARMIVAENQEVISHAMMQFETKDDDKFIKALFAKQIDRIGISQNTEGF